MSGENVLTERSKAMLYEMHAHVQRRLEKRLAKYEGRTDTQSKTEVKKAYERYKLDSILKKGANCAPGVAIATHVAKATHPDLQVKLVSNPKIEFDGLPRRSEVGSHLLPSKDSLADATGNGAVNSSAYELYLLLETRFEAKRFSEWLGENDRDALSAFAQGAESEDASDVYSNLLESKSLKPATDARLKQLYWLVGEEPGNDANYRLLAPLYATALAHRVYAHVSLNTWFYGDRNKAARKALNVGSPMIESPIEVILC